jgi:phosphoglycolate phosphatase-like HAD superfamily hydrolase
VIQTRPLRAVLWDFDGTLVDTRARNMSVNRRIIAEITGRDWSEFEVMRSQEAYDRAQRGAANWREFYRTHCRLSDDDIDRAGSRWGAYQLCDPTPVPLFGGIAEALAGVDGMPQAIVSQNARETIETVLAGHGLGGRFRCIVGYAEVAMERQKPAPDGLLAALGLVAGTAPGVALYVGDHPTDLRCVEGANRELVERDAGLRVVSVAALWGDGHVGRGWADAADVRVTSPADVVALVDRLTDGRS